MHACMHVCAHKHACAVSRYAHTLLHASTAQVFINDLVNRLTISVFAPSAIIIRQGERGHGMYFLSECRRIAVAPLPSRSLCSSIDSASPNHCTIKIQCTRPPSCQGDRAHLLRDPRGQ